MSISRERAIDVLSVSRDTLSGEINMGKWFPVKLDELADALQFAIEEIKELDRLRARLERAVELPPYQPGDILYEVDPELAVCEVTSVQITTGYICGVKENGIFPPTWRVYVNVIDGHGKGSHYSFEPDDFGRTVFHDRTQAEAAQQQQGHKGWDTLPACSGPGEVCLVDWRKMTGEGEI